MSNEARSDGLTWSDLTEAELDLALAINAANVPEVGPLDRAKLERLWCETAWAPCVREAGRPVGIALLLREGASYASPNYRWFSERHPHFLYVDRIALLPEARGRGVGRALYQEAVERARAADVPVLCAEVNTLPPNPASLTFHRRLGFVELERRRPYSESEEVVMLELATGAAAGPSPRAPR